jgi:thioredoxin reductase (NADPH)
MGSGYRKLGIPDEDRLSGHGVSWCATCDGFFFRDQHVLVVGGGDSALEEATFLTRFARKVTLVHRRTSLRASKIMQDRAFADPKLDFAWDSVVDSLHGDDRLTGVRLRDVHSGATTDVEATGLFIAVGHDPSLGATARTGRPRRQRLRSVKHPFTHTNLAGVFACGDLVDHHYRQAVTAAGTGCAAALDAERYLAALDQITNSVSHMAAALAEAAEDPAVLLPPAAGDSPQPGGSGNASPVTASRT